MNTKLIITVGEGSRVANTPEAMAKVSKTIWANYGAHFVKDEKTGLPKKDNVSGKWTVLCPLIQVKSLMDFLKRAQQLDVSR